MRKVMVFGVFDRLHEGHRHFLREARRHGDWLIAVVTPDHIVYDLKGYVPEEHVGDRMELLAAEGFADQVVMGDRELRDWRVLRAHRPHVVALGYDQTHWQHEVEAAAGGLGWQIEIHVMPPHEPERHHTSLHRRKKKKKGSA